MLILTVFATLATVAMVVEGNSQFDINLIEPVSNGGLLKQENCLSIIG